MSFIREIDCETATQQLVKGEIRGPVAIKIEGFDPVCSEVLFLEMEHINGIYEPLLGTIILEQSQAAVDRLSHRLIHVKKADLKRLFLEPIDELDPMALMGVFENG